MGEFTFRIVETVNQAIPLQVDQQLHIWSADWWVVVAQVSSAIAIIVAAIVAGSFQNIKEKRLKNTQRRYYLTFFRLFIDNIDMYYYHSLADDVLPEGFTCSDLMVQIKVDYLEIINEKKDIIKYLPSQAMDPFQGFLNGMNVVFNQKGEDSNTFDSWKYPKEKLEYVILLIGIRGYPLSSTYYINIHI